MPSFNTKEMKVLIKDHKEGTPQAKGENQMLPIDSIHVNRGDSVRPWMTAALVVNAKH